MASRLADVASGTKPSIELGDAAAEANHRIANNLAIIAEYVRSELLFLDQEKTADFQSIRRSLQHLSLRIDAIGRLHRLLTSSSPEAGVEISTYLREIAGAAQCSLAPDERIKILFLSDTEASVTAKQAAAIGAIASEALVNSIKHSHPANEPGVISIGCKRIRCGGLLIEIQDDGVGRSHEHPGEQREGAGTDLMRAFARSLNATLEIIDGHPGHIVRFELPLSDQRTQ
jgi:two-component sensor histidine kinase